MMEILKFIGGLGEVLMVITPLTLVIGIINAIKKDGNSSAAYKAMAVLSAYLIVVPLIVNSVY
jgi:hypothetical protein